MLTNKLRDFSCVWSCFSCDLDRCKFPDFVYTVMVVVIFYWCEVNGR